MTKPSYEELESQLARALADSYNNKRDNEILAELSQILVGYREGSHDLLRERAEVLAEAEDNLEAAETELARVRGLLQRLVGAVKELEGTPIEYRIAMELANILKAAESADIGKLDTADKSAITFSQGAPPMAGTPSIVSEPFEKPDEGEWVQPIESGYRMRCCDCKLTHRMDFRVYEGRAQFRVFREDENGTESGVEMGKVNRVEEKSDV